MQEKVKQLEALRKQLEISAEEMEAQADELEEIRSAAEGGLGREYTRGEGGKRLGRFASTNLMTF